jgi:hypothetical protein
VSAKPRQNPQVAWREIDGQVVIVSPEDSVLHELNPTASAIWRHATGERTGAQIAAALAEEYEVSEAVALADTEELLAALVERKLLVMSPAEDADG